MYIYVNTTEAALEQKFTELLELREKVQNGSGESCQGLADKSLPVWFPSWIRGSGLPACIELV